MKPADVGTRGGKHIGNCLLLGLLIQGGVQRRKVFRPATEREEGASTIVTQRFLQNYRRHKQPIARQRHYAKEKGLGRHAVSVAQHLETDNCIHKMPTTHWLECVKRCW